MAIAATAIDTGLTAHTYSLNSKGELTYLTSVYSIFDVRYSGAFATAYLDWCSNNLTDAVVIS